ncbi:alpha/beta fold hydrolase [Kutzneria sp. CA-103260]|uniref:alpha/beta fold hydrolase n=1 Tax=Kutzneria sp. CA-103260 TaxID=2802641 RepID=UPI001BA781DE|nr:alpha/beta hydrolase [Kutzneria sp. CA-103260]QUQ65795.1 alpha/beta fold hydrolase [Kutzneria sp. CA-103260]
MDHLDLSWGRCRWRRAGDGPAVVLVHGWSCSAHTWDDVGPLLVRAGLSVIDYDVRAHGASTWTGSVVTMAELAADLQAVIAGLGVRKPLVCGHSLGGMIALEHAFAYPAEVSGLVLVGTGVGQRPDDQVLYDTLSEYFTHSSNLEPWWPLFEAALYSPDYRATAGSRLAGVRERFLGSDLAAELGVLGAVIGREDLTERLAALAVPTAMVAGEQDSIWPVEGHEVMAGRIPGAELTVITGAGHLVPEEAPGELAEVIIRMREKAA